MSKYTRRPHTFARRNIAAKPQKLATHDVRKLEAKTSMNIQKSRIGNESVHYDARDPRPHTVHKVTYRHPRTGERKTGFFKRIYKSFHEMHQQHLKNKEERAKIREIEAQAAIEKAEGKRLEYEGKASLQRAKAERARARGEEIKSVEEGFATVEVGAGEGVRRLERGFGEGVGAANKEQGR